VCRGNPDLTERTKRREKPRQIAPRLPRKRRRKRPVGRVIIYNSRMNAINPRRAGKPSPVLQRRGCRLVVVMKPDEAAWEVKF